MTRDLTRYLNIIARRNAEKINEGHAKVEKARREKEQRKKDFLKSSLDHKLKVIREYNAKYNTNFSYGYFVAYVRNGIIEL